MAHILVSVLMGGVIGYITNDIAIRMLFHPRKPLYIGKWHIPLTPGLIPSQQPRIAASIGRMSESLLDPESVKDALTSEETLLRVRGAMEKFTLRLSEDERTLREALAERLGEEKTAELTDRTVKSVSGRLAEAVSEADLGGKLSELLSRTFHEKSPGWIAGVLLASGAEETIKIKIANMLNDEIREKAPGFIEREARERGEKLLDKKICELMPKDRETYDKVIDQLIGLYGDAVRRNMPAILKTADIAGIIERKILSFDTVELENMLVGLMKKELRAIIWLGAALGMIMGVVTWLLNG